MNGRSLLRQGNVVILYPEDREEITKDQPIASQEDYDEDEVTVKIQVPTFPNQVVVAEEDRYPGIGLTMALAIGVAMWFLPAYYLIMWYIGR